MAVDYSGVSLTEGGTTYCSVADVQLLVKRFQFSTSTKITTLDVEEHIKEKHYEILSVLKRAGIALPIPSSAYTAVDILKRVNAYGAAGIVEQILVLAAEPKGSARSEWFEKKFMDWLDRIAANPQLLYDAPQAEARMVSSKESVSDGSVAFPEADIQDFIDTTKISGSGYIVG